MEIDKDIHIELEQKQLKQKESEQKELKQKGFEQNKLKQNEFERNKLKPDELLQEKSKQKQLEQKNTLTEKNFQVRFSVLNFTLIMLEEVLLPERKEVVLRGGIGDMLLKQYCVRNAKCEGCDFVHSCLVQNFMYAKYKKKPDFVTTGESMGYVLSAEEKKIHYKRGDYLYFSLTLFGDVIAYLNPIIQTIYLLGQYGIGESRARYQIEKIQNRCGGAILKDGSIYYKNCLIEILADYIKERKQQLKESHLEGDYRISFSSPLSIKYRGEFIQKFDIQAILNGITRRIYMLECFEGRECIEKKFLENPIIVDQTIKVFDSHRYSSRTKQYMPFKGISGEMILTQIEEELFDYLFAGEITHIGKNTRFGFGKYKVREK